MNWTSQKKRAEKAVLRMIYDLDAFQSVERSERPDFVLRRSSTSAAFGVEVTRFYTSEADARLDNIRGYVRVLLEGGRHRHKDDVKALPVKDITITKPDGTVHAATKAIMQTLPPLADHIRMITERIEAKEAALSIRPELSHVNLIVQDKTGRLGAVPPEDFTALFLTTDLRKVLATTRFREVFFVTTVRQNRNVFFPLRMLLLVSDLFLFNEVRMAYASEEVTAHSWDEELTLFGSFIRYRGVPAMLATRTADQGVQVILGNSGVIVADGGVTVRNYTDWPLSQTWSPPEHRFGEDFFAFHDKYAAEHVFTSGIVFDVRK